MMSMRMATRGIATCRRALVTSAASTKTASTPDIIGTKMTGTSDIMARMETLTSVGQSAAKVRGREYLPQNYDALLPEYVYGPAPGASFPTALQMPKDVSVKEVGELARELITTRLPQAGVLLLRGTPMTNGADFSTFSQAHALEVPTEKIGGGLTPRKDVAKNVRTASVDPPVVTIEPHSDHVHASLMPDILIFLCIAGPPPGYGGENVTTDMRKVTQEMNDAGITDMFKERGGIKYLKKLWSSETVEHSFTWQNRFFVDTLPELEAYLKSNDVTDWTIDGDGVLTYSNTLPATRTHPVTGEELFINGAHSNHFTYHEAKLYEITPDDAPADTVFANGEKIPYDVLAKIRRSLWTNSAAVLPQVGDLFLVDNRLAYHARMGWDEEVKRTLLISDASYPAAAYTQ